MRTGPERRCGVQEHRGEQKIERLGAGNQNELDGVSVQRRVHRQQQGERGREEPPQRLQDQHQRRHVEAAIDDDKSGPGEHNIANVHAFPYPFATVLRHHVLGPPAQVRRHKGLQRAEGLVDERADRGIERPKHWRRGVLLETAGECRDQEGVLAAVAVIGVGEPSRQTNRFRLRWAIGKEQIDARGNEQRAEQAQEGPRSDPIIGTVGRPCPNKGGFSRHDVSHDAVVPRVMFPSLRQGPRTARANARSRHPY